MTLLICVQTSTKHSIPTSTTTTTTSTATTAPPPAPPQLDNYDNYDNENDEDDENEGRGRVEHEKGAQTTRLASSGP